MQLKVGSTLQGGKYRIIRILGQGGFGITYLAENTFFEKKVAVKEFFPKDFCGRDATSHLTLGTQNNAATVTKLRDRFLKEARNIARLDNPGIVRIHDVFEENNTAYYVMDYIEGESLADIVKRRGPLPEGNAIEYIRQVGEALEYIHSRNMTHFDVKPANIVVRRSDNRPILIDFGLSKQYDSQGDATSTLMQAVSHGYAPMEQYNNSGVSSFSPQTDVYSLAATLLYLLTGEQPPQASVLIEDGLEVPAHIDRRVAAAIEKGMAPTRKNRYATVKDFIAALPDIAPVDLDADDSTRLLDDGTSAECQELRKKLNQLEAQLKNRDKALELAQADNGKLDQAVKMLTAKLAEKKPDRKWLIAFCAAAVALLISVWLNFQQSSEINTLTYSSDRYMAQTEQLQSTLEYRDGLIKEIAKKDPVLLFDGEVRGEGLDYGEDISSSESTYLYSRFRAINLTDKDKVVNVKFYAPEGLSTGTASRDGYSFADTLRAGTGVDGPEWLYVKGWGSTEVGNWSPGNYRIELWVDGKCIDTKGFSLKK